MLLTFIQRPALLAPILCAPILFVATASATTVPVSYTVDSKALNSGTPAGSVLTVELFENSLCNGAPIASESVAIEDFTITELIKQFAAKGAETKPPKITRLNIAIEEVVQSAGADLFLSINGPGVTPVGGSCQPQVAAGPQGAPGADGIAGPAGPTGPTGATGPVGPSASSSCVILQASCAGVTSCSSTCSPGKQVVAGGCSCGTASGTNTLRASSPSADSFSWNCRCSSFDSVFVWATCCP